MPIPKRRVKRENRVVKIVTSDGRPKATEQTKRGSLKDTGNAAQVPSPSVCQSRRAKLSVADQGLQPKNQKRNGRNKYVPVRSQDDKALMPAKESRVRRWLKTGQAIKRWKKGIFYVQLTFNTLENIQSIVLSIDPGSKFEGYTVKSKAHTYHNIQENAVTWVSDRVETRAMMRRSRRNRKTPCRKPRFNRSKRKGWLAPSTHARWQLKLNMVKRLNTLYPINHIVIEDIKAESKKGKRKWNKSFSPLETGKNWFCHELEKIAHMSIKYGHETHKLRTALGLRKSGNKAERNFDAHCVDSWVLANDYVGGHTTPDNTDVIFIKPIQLYRRQLHVLQPSKGNYRKPFGGTKGFFKKGSVVKHKKHGICIVGGNSKRGISLHDRNTGERITQKAKIEDITFLCYNSWYVSRL